jgi:hypothetical protein
LIGMTLWKLWKVMKVSKRVVLRMSAAPRTDTNLLFESINLYTYLYLLIHAMTHTHVNRRGGQFTVPQFLLRRRHHTGLPLRGFINIPANEKP